MSEFNRAFAKSAELTVLYAVTADTVITAPASDLYLWTWGRVPESVLTVSGDADLAALVRDVVATVT